MLSYTKRQIVMSLALFLSVVLNAWLIYVYCIDVSPANRQKYAYLFPGIGRDSVGQPDVEQLLRYSYVFVVGNAPTNKLFLLSRDHCTEEATLELANEQPFDPGLYAHTPIIIDAFSSADGGGIVLLEVREDTFATQHLDDLKRACPSLSDIFENDNS